MLPTSLHPQHASCHLLVYPKDKETCELSDSSLLQPCFPDAVVRCLLQLQLHNRRQVLACIDCVLQQHSDILYTQTKSNVPGSQGQKVGALAFMIAYADRSC